MRPLVHRLNLLVSAAAAAVLATTALSATPAAAESATLPILAVDTAHLPDVHMTVAVPDALARQALPPGAFSVVEQGRPRPVRVDPVDTRDLEVGLVLDTSASMAGAPLAAAKQAARDLLGRLPAWVPVTVVTMGSAPSIVSPPSTDRSTQTARIDAVQASGETALYDGVSAASAQLAGIPAGRRFVVLLSDGGDTASRIGVESTVLNLNRASVTVLAVQLTTAESNGASLERLATATGGRVVQASDPASLGAAFSTVAQQLVQQYTLTYRSVAGGPVDVDVLLDAQGVRAAAHRRLELPTASRPPSPAAGTRAAPRSSFHLGGWALFAGAGLCGAALLIVLLPLLSSRTPRSKALRGAQRDRGLALMADRASNLADRALEGSDRKSWLSRALEQGGISLRPGEVAVMTGCAVVVAFALGQALSGPIAGAVLAAATLAAGRVTLGVLASRRRRRFADQLGDTLQMLASGLRAGYGLGQCVDIVAKEAEEPTAEEFRRLTVETRLGRDLDDALGALAERMQSVDLNWVVQAVEIHRQVGGDLAGVLDTVGNTIRDRNRIRRQVQAASAEGRLSAGVLFALPFGVGGLTALIHPDYLSELTSSSLGWGLLGAGAVLMAVGGLWLRQIVRPEF